MFRQKIVLVVFSLSFGWRHIKTLMSDDITNKCYTHIDLDIRMVWAQSESFLLRTAYLIRIGYIFHTTFLNRGRAVHTCLCEWEVFFPSMLRSAQRKLWTKRTLFIIARTSRFIWSVGTRTRSLIKLYESVFWSWSWELHCTVAETRLSNTHSRIIQHWLRSQFTYCIGEKKNCMDIEASVWTFRFSLISFVLVKRIYLTFC